MRLFSPDSRDFDTLTRRFQWQLPPRFNIAQAVCDRHADDPDRIALYWQDDKGDQHHCSFSQLRAYSNRFANALRALGVERGDRIAIVLPQRLETALAHLAAYKLGAIALPLSVLFGPDAVCYRLQDSGANTVITDSRRYPVIESLYHELPGLQHVITCDATVGQSGSGALDFWRLIEAANESLTPIDTVPDDPAMLIYTSGTTGSPKGALNGHRCLLGNLPGFELSHNFFPQQNDLFWTPADWAWTGGLLDALMPSWYYGIPVLAQPEGRFDPERACDLLARFQVRNAFIPPTALKMLMQFGGIDRYPVRLRSVMSAGEALGEAPLAWAEQALGLTVNEMWGQTEANYLVGNCSAIMPVRPGSMGKPYPGHRVSVIDESGEIRPAGETGELAVHRDDPVMCLEYWNRPEAMADKQRGNWFCTGDVGYCDPDGYLWFMGRTDDVISSAGYRIGPGEIEDCLIKHPAVAQAAVIGVPDPMRGEIIKAFIVAAEGYSTNDTLADEIRQSVRTRLAAYEYPREIEFIDALPMTTTGKIRRVELRRRHQQQSS